MKEKLALSFQILDFLVLSAQVYWDQCLVTRPFDQKLKEKLTFSIQILDFLILSVQVYWDCCPAVGSVDRNLCDKLFGLEKNFSNGQLWNNAPEALLLPSSPPAQNKRRIKKQPPISQGHKFWPNSRKIPTVCKNFVFMFVSKMAFALEVFEGSKFSNIWRFSQYSKSFAACTHPVGGLELLHIMPKSRFWQILED